MTRKPRPDEDAAPRPPQPRDARGRFASRTATPEAAPRTREARDDATPTPEPRGKRAGRAARDADDTPKRTPYKAQRLTTVEGKYDRTRFRDGSGRFATSTQAKSSIRRAERDQWVQAAAKVTGKSDAEIRREIRGIPTKDLTGAYRGIAVSGKGTTIRVYRDKPSDKAQAHVRERLGIIDLRDITDVFDLEAWRELYE